MSIMTMNRTELRGMPTRPVEEDEPEAFDGHDLAYSLLKAHVQAQKSLDAIEEENRKLTATDGEIRRLEAKLIASFQVSEVGSVECSYEYQRFTIAPFDGKILVLSLGYAHSLKAPIHQAFTLPIIAAHAAVDDFDDPDEIVAACNS